MLQSDLKVAKNLAESAYIIIKDHMSEGLVSLIDLAYPNHDGKQDADAVSDMMLLRQSLNSLSQACQIWIGKLSEAIGNETKEVK